MSEQPIDLRRTLAELLRGDLTDLSDERRREISTEVIATSSLAAAAVTLQPLPFLDTFLTTAVQLLMVQAIARAHGYRLDRRSITELLSVFGASFVSRHASMAVAKMVPVAGSAVTARSRPRPPPARPGSPPRRRRCPG